ncbi:hypothetical protein [Hoeflea sp.]|uniref:hypothetical protein n=1 Tax=Hoeflea sp. TaxID=1940281 RepID=UPI003B522AB2
MDKTTEDGNSILNATRFKQILIIAFASVAFFMTAYATSGGARLFLTESYAWIGITALAVGFLAFTSVVLGDGISSNKMTQVALVTPFYLVAVAICWICSFASYHQQFLTVGGSDLANAETNLRQMGLYAHEIDQDLNGRFSDQREALLNDEVIRTYSAQMASLADELRDRDTKREIAVELETLIAAKIDELQQRQVQLQSQQGALQAEDLRLTPQIANLEQAVADRQAEWVASGELIGQLETALRDEEGDTNLPLGSRGVLLADGLASQLVDDPACNRRRRAGTGGGLEGTCYYAIGAKLAETRAATEAARRAYEAALSDLQEARRKQASLRAELGALEQELKTASAQATDGVASGYTLDADGFLQSVNAFIDTPSQATFKQTADYCTVVTEVLADLQSFSEIPACEPQPIMAIFRQVETLDAEQASYSLACDEADRRKEIVTTLRSDIAGQTGADRLAPISRAYETMRSDVLEGCIVAAESGGVDMSRYREDISGFVDRINPSQDPISTAMGKIQSLFNGTASARDYFPALLALLQELSLLLSKLFWDASIAAKARKKKEDFDVSELDLDARPDDPESVLAAKNIILNSVFDRQGYRLPMLYDEEYSHEMRNQMRLLVDSLIRRQLARKTGQGILISEAGMAEIGKRILRHGETASGKPEPSPAETAPAPVSEQAAPANQPKDVPSLRSAENDTGDESHADTGEDKPGSEETAEIIDADLAQRPRRRRPVVVRPNFRREI